MPPLLAKSVLPVSQMRTKFCHGYFFHERTILEVIKSRKTRLCISMGIIIYVALPETTSALLLNFVLRLCGAPSSRCWMLQKQSKACSVACACHNSCYELTMMTWKALLDIMTDCVLHLKISDTPKLTRKTLPMMSLCNTGAHLAPYPVGQLHIISLL